MWTQHLQKIAANLIPEYREYESSLGSTEGPAICCVQEGVLLLNAEVWLAGLSLVHHGRTGGPVVGWVGPEFLTLGFWRLKGLTEDQDVIASSKWIC